MTVKIDSATIISSLETAIELSDEKMSHKLLGELFVCFLFDLEFRLFGCLAYSSVPNRRACTFNNFEQKFPPARPYLGLHVYLGQIKI